MYLFGLELYDATRQSTPGEGSIRNIMHERQSQIFALVVAGLVALSACQVQAAIEVKMYALGTALVSFSSWLLLRALQANRAVLPWACYGLCTGALLYTHHYGLLSVIAQFVFLAVYLLGIAWRGRTAQAVNLFRRIALVGILMALAYLPWALAFRVQVERVRRSFWIGPVRWEWFLQIFGELMLPEQVNWSPAVLLGLAAGALVVLLLAWRLHPASGLVLASTIGPMLLAALISLWTPIWYPRYFRFAHLFFLAALALALWRIRARAIRVLLTGWVLVNFLAASVDLWMSLDIPHKPGMRGAMARIQAENRDAELMVVISPYHYFLAKYYAPPGLEVRLLQPPEPMQLREGAAVVVPEDFISHEELASRLHRGIWIIAPWPGPYPIAALDSCQVLTSFHTEFYYRFLVPIHAAYCVS